MRRSVVLAGVAIALTVALVLLTKILVAWRVPSVPVLAYCDIMPGSAETRARRAGTAPALSPDEFEANLAWLKRTGHRAVSIDELVAFAQGRGRLPSKPVVITFDDGWEGVYQFAFPLLSRYGFKATVFLIASRVQDPKRRTPFRMDGATMLDWDQVREMEASGLVEFESHSYDLHRLSPTGAAPPDTPVAVAHLLTESGPEADALYRARLARDFHEASHVLEEQLGHRTRYMAWPYGAYTPQALEAARATGCLAAFTEDLGVVRAGDSTLALRRIPVNERGASDLGGTIALARYAPELASLKQAVRALVGTRGDP